MAGTPGTHGIVEVTTRLLATDLPREYLVNHYAVDSISTSVTDANWQALADAFKNFHFATTGTHVNFGNSYGGFVNVYALDASPEMVAIARSRGIDAHTASIESLGGIVRPYDGALSNFGALNCIEDLRPVAANLGRIIRPGGYIVLCMMTRFCWNETLTGLSRLDTKTAFRRWRGR